jgi:hypothetical protein
MDECLSFPSYVTESHRPRAGVASVWIGHPSADAARKITHDPRPYQTHSIHYLRR